ncbi:hypothetical protein [Desulfovibrio desulfuricans]|uniref:hypothetical protein n=1 Tax=Desulfovibrio desulfuricans TaxID=876 RepID=UPI001C02B0F8|nr:hypothetical protein [Desulfovibrio desulfuricans]MBT9749880.1 hypothetical protein [Desulfovibrio desulfuricans]
MLRDYFKLWPTREEYLRWSKVSKLSFISTYITIILLIFSCLNFLYSFYIEMRLASMPKEHFFEGPWDEKKASSQFLEILRAAESHDAFAFSDSDFARNNPIYKKEDGECDFDQLYQCKKGSRYAHGVQGFYHVLMNGAVSVIGVGFTKLVNFDCHCCRPEFSIIEYVQEGTRWKIKSADINAFEVGEFGIADCKIDIVSIGYGAFAVRVKSQETPGNVTQVSTCLLSKIKDKYTNIFVNFDAFIYNKFDGKSYACTTNAQIVRDGLSYYEIKVSTEDKDKRCPNFKEVTYFFDGVRYVSKDGRDPFEDYAFEQSIFQMYE